jgi:hypothetical protein
MLRTGCPPATLQHNLAKKHFEIRIDSISIIIIIIIIIIILNNVETSSLIENNWSSKKDLGTRTVPK